MIEKGAAHVDPRSGSAAWMRAAKVDAVPDQVVSLHHDIRDVQTEPHLERLATGRLCAGQRTANLEGTAHRVHGARKFGEHAPSAVVLKIRPSSRPTFSEISAWQFATRAAVYSPARSINAE